MEAYPEYSLTHNLPLVLLSGLGSDNDSANEPPEKARSVLQEGGFRIRTDYPQLTIDAAQALVKAFLAA
jgi:hypothetical protein